MFEVTRMQHGEDWHFNTVTGKFVYTYKCESTGELFMCECKTIVACRTKRNKWILEDENRW